MSTPITRKGEVGQAGNPGQFAAKAHAEADDSVGFSMEREEIPVAPCPGSYPHVRDDVRPISVTTPLEKRLHIGRQDPGEYTGGGMIRGSERRDFIDSPMLIQRAGGDLAAQSEYLERHREDIHEFVNEKYSANYYIGGHYPDGTPMGVVEFVSGASPDSNDEEALGVLRKDTGIDSYAGTPREPFEMELGTHLDRCDAVEAIAADLRADRGLVQEGDLADRLRAEHGLTDEIDRHALHTLRMADAHREASASVAMIETDLKYASGEDRLDAHLSPREMAQYTLAREAAGFGTATARDHTVGDLRSFRPISRECARTEWSRVRNAVLKGQSEDSIRSLARRKDAAPF